MSKAVEEYHVADITRATCLRCGKPMTEWRAFDVCPANASGHILPSSIPTGFVDKGFLYRCDECGYNENQSDDEIPPYLCPECSTGMMSIDGWIEEHGTQRRS